MSNEITNNINKKTPIINNYVKKIANKEENAKNSVVYTNDIEEKNVSAMPFLGAIGAAKVNMDNTRVNKSIEEFLEDPAYVKAHVDFCDDLVQNKGYSLEDALCTTDNVFKALKDSHVYPD